MASRTTRKTPARRRALARTHAPVTVKGPPRPAEAPAAADAGIERGTADRLHAWSGWQHPTNRAMLTGELPRSVAIVGLGPSRQTFFDLLTKHEPGVTFDEVWTLNTGLRYVPHDLVFVMDDLVDFSDHYPEYGDALRLHTRPIITSAATPEFPWARNYPLHKVLAQVPAAMHSAFYHNSMPYLLAYCALLGTVERLALFGVDYSHPDIAAREAGREVCALWIGFLRGVGVEVDIASTSTMLNTHQLVHDPLYRPFYGYVRQPAVPGVTR